MTPIENVKSVINAASDVATGVINALADKKINFMEVLGLVAPLGQLSAIDFKAAKDEWLNADNEAKAEIMAYAEETIDLGNDVTEDKVEAVFGMLIYGGSLFAHNQAA